LKRRFSPWTAAVAMMLGVASTGAFAQNDNPAPPAPPANTAPAETTPATPANPAPPAPPATNEMPPSPPANPGPPMPPPPSAPAPPKPKHLVAPPGVAATVNGEKITTSQVSTLALKMDGARVADQLISNLLITQEAKKKKITVSPTEMAARVAEARQQIKQQYPTRTLEDLLDQNHLTLADLKERIRIGVLAEKLAGGNFKPTPSVHVRHILILTQNPMGAPDAKPHTEAEAQELITKIQAELKAGKKFEDLAKQYSEDQNNKERGGDLGIINAQTGFDPGFLQAALKLKKGGVTATPVKSVYGLHLIKADSTSTDPTPADKPLYDAANKQAQQQQLAAVVPAYLQQLRTKAKIVNYLGQ
jgi:hypothetical protein